MRVRNKKVTGWLLSVGIFAIGAGIIYQMFVNDSPNEAISKRSIRLREWRPNWSASYTPQLEQLDHSDALVQKAYPVRIDSEGFMVYKPVHTPTDYSLVFLGGSTTECLYVEDSLRFPYLTAQMLENQTGKIFNSYNGAMGGNNSMHSINLLLNKVIPMQPHVVIMMHNVNDWNVLIKEKDYWNNNPSKSMIIDPHGGKKTEKDEWKHIRGKKVEYELSEVIEKFKQAQHLFIDICQRYEIEPVLMTQASRFTDQIEDKIHHGIINHGKDLGFTYQVAKTLQDTFNMTIRTVARERSVLLIDLDAHIPKTSDYMYDIVHFHKGGTKAAAEFIAAALKKHFQWLGK